MSDETRGLRIAAGMMLSKCLRAVGQEKTEIEGNDTETGNARVVTKAEALARTMWRLALGWKEEYTEEDAVTHRKKLIVKQHKPDNAMIALIFDRVEGKVASQESDKAKRQPLSQKVGEQAKRRVNALVGNSNGDSETASE